VLLLAGAALWPRAGGGMSTEELSRSARESGAARTTAARAETAAAKLVSAPGNAKLVVAAAGESDLTN
jgi:hypothetical protein